MENINVINFSTTSLKDEKKVFEINKQSAMINVMKEIVKNLDWDEDLTTTQGVIDKSCECIIENYQNFHELSPKKSPFTKNVISRYVQACMEGSYKTLQKFIEFEVNLLPQYFTKEQCKYLSKRYLYLGIYYDIEVKRKKGTFVIKKNTRPYDDYKKDTLPKYEEYLEERFA